MATQRNETSTNFLDTILNTYWGLGFVLISCLFIFLSSAVFVLTFFFQRDHEVSGHLGDSFGVINALFSCLAFGGLFYTILLQKKELKETRIEFEKQARIFNQQRSDDMFFALLELHRKTQLPLVKNDVSGNVFKAITRKYHRVITDHRDEDLDTKIGLIEDAIAELDYKTMNYFEDRYIRSLMTLLNFLPANSEIYMDILLSDSSEQEITSILICGILMENLRTSLIKTNYASISNINQYLGTEFYPVYGYPNQPRRR